LKLVTSGPELEVLLVETAARIPADRLDQSDAAHTEAMRE
jgi:hypothetical protein